MNKDNWNALYQNNLWSLFSGENNDWLLKQLPLIKEKQQIKMNIESNFWVKNYNLIPENDVKNMIYFILIHQQKQD